MTDGLWKIKIDPLGESGVEAGEWSPLLKPFSKHYPYFNLLDIILLPTIILVFIV